MNYTKNYHLPQWEEEDRIQMQDFNQMCQDMEAGLIGSSYHVGSYTGNGAELSAGGFLVELGFRPKFVVVSKGWIDANAMSRSTFILTEHPNSGAERYFRLEDNGFRVGLCAAAGGNSTSINAAGNVYDFVALR